MDIVFEYRFRRVLAEFDDIACGISASNRCQQLDVNWMSKKNLSQLLFLASWRLALLFSSGQWFESPDSCDQYSVSGKFHKFVGWLRYGNLPVA